MAFENIPAANAQNESEPNPGAWYRGLTRYHWFVFVVASLGWLFDTMDQQLFNLARNSAITELLGRGANADAIARQGGYATSIFMIGWAIGGLFFGVLGDRIGRAKTMLLTILVYSGFTGLSAISIGVWDFACYRFLTGLGVGGEFAVGVALVAEVMPDRSRPFALGMLQALSAIGNITAGFVSIAIGLAGQAKIVDPTRSWRLMFLIGIIPAVLAIPIFRKLKEPERWKKAATIEGSDPVKYKLGSLAEFFGDRRWRSNAIVGMTLAFAGVVGLWGIGFFSPELIDSVFKREFAAQGLNSAEISAKLTIWKGITFIIQNTGAFFGVYAFSHVSHRLGRRPAFAIAFILAMASTAFTFHFFNRFSDIFWMIPIMGFCQLSIFGGYAIYFPELFPTRLRSTGTSFCYNVGRLVAAVGPTLFGLLTGYVFVGYAQPIRPAGVAMCGVFLIGLLVLPFAPETKGKSLPE